MESAKVVNIKDGESKVVRALLRARANFKKVVKDATNTFFKNSKYATLGAYIEATEDALTAEDLLVIPKFHVIEGKLYLELIISHPCGESIPSGPYPLNPAKETPDQYGSALSYARRYLLSSMLNLVSEDDDGAGSSGHGKEEKPEQKPEPKKPQPVDFVKILPAPDVSVVMDAARARWGGKTWKLNDITAHLNQLAAKVEPLTVEGMIAAVKAAGDPEK